MKRDTNNGALQGARGMALFFKTAGVDVRRMERSLSHDTAFR